MALLAQELRDVPRAQGGLAGRARPLPTPERLHALIALRHASAASLLGEKAAFQSGITQARRELYRGPYDEKPPEWLRFVDHTEITGVEARGWLNLGDAARSATLYRKVLTCELSPRNRASYGAGLARHVTAAGIRVVEVDRSDRQDRRRQGKSDPLDAVSAARAAQSGRARGAPKGRDGAVEAIRALMVAKRSARSERTPDHQPGQVPDRHRAR